jgi:hypothetical protein
MVRTLTLGVGPV